jgi:sulfite reductase (NADPH) hemoprotein beta-component
MDATRKNDLSRPLDELHSNERLKHRSRFLRGTLADSLIEPASASIAPDDALLTK